MNTQIFEVSDVKYGKTTIEKGIILGQRNYRWTLKRQYNPFFAKESGGEYLSELTPHKKNFQIYIPVAKLEKDMEFSISKSEYKNPEKVLTTYKVKDIFGQYVECDVIEETRETRKALTSKDLEPKEPVNMTEDVFGDTNRETVESLGDWFEMMGQGIDLDEKKTLTEQQTCDIQAGKTPQQLDRLNDSPENVTNTPQKIDYTITLGSDEHYKILEQFEKDFDDMRLDREPFEHWNKGYVYQSGETNKLYTGYVKGISTHKTCNVQTDSQKPETPIEATEIEVIEEPLETRVLNVLPLNFPPKHIDVIAQEAQISMSQALSALTMLDLKGKVKQFPGMHYQANVDVKPGLSKCVTPRKKKVHICQEKRPEKQKTYTSELWTKYHTTKAGNLQKPHQINLLYTTGEQSDLFL